MDAIRDDYLALSAREERLSAKRIVRHHQHCLKELARPAHGRMFWGPLWFVGEAPKRLHVSACPSYARLRQIWKRLQLRTPVEFLDLTDQPLPKSFSRWGDVRPRDIEAALGARRLWRSAIGLSGAVTSDLFVVLLGSTVRDAFGATNLRPYAWYSLPRYEQVLGELFLATIPHPSPLASRVFDEGQVMRLLERLHYVRGRRPTLARGYRRVEDLGLVALDE